MARTKQKVLISSPVPPESVPGGTPTPLKAGRAYASIDGVRACEFRNDAGELKLVPPEYERRQEFEEDCWREADDSVRCWNASFIYSQLPPHPRLARFVRMDEWTGFPVLSKPTGPSLRDFLHTYYDVLHELRPDGTNSKTTASSRVNTRYLPLMYQWTLQLANALKHVHACNAAPLHTVFGTPKLSACFLAMPSLALSIVGFLDASFQKDHWGNRYLGRITTDHLFRPNDEYSTEQTDLFMFGCAVYELMTSVWPGELQGLTFEQQTRLVTSQSWPTLEVEHLGRIVRGCWASEFANAEQLMSSLQETTIGLGWTLRGEDEIQGFDAAILFA